MDSPKKNILFLADLQTEASVQYTCYAISFLQKYSPLLVIFTQDVTTFKNTQLYSKEDRVDFVVVIGSSSLLQRSFGLFQFKDSPPIIGLGSNQDPILFNYCVSEAEELLDLIAPQLLINNIHTQNCMKLQILSAQKQPLAQSTCQIQIHRGMYKSVLKVNMYIVNKCTDEPIKIAQMCGDGLLISTPMGSMCKSMNLNGPIMNKEMENIFIMAMCPLSLKFRPLCLPSNTQLLLQIDQSSRSSGFVYIDGYDSGLSLAPGQKILVSMSKFKTKLASSMLISEEERFIQGLRKVLHWGELYESRGYFSGLKKKSTIEQQGI